MRMDKSKEAEITLTDFNEIFRGKTPVCECITGTAHDLTDATVKQSREKQVLKKLSEKKVYHCQVLLATESAEQVLDTFPFEHW